MDKNLYVFGCSFTDYPQWPVWCEWLATCFPGDNYFKYALGGSGNRAIFHHIMGYLNSKEDFSKDVVVVQWGSSTREDKYHIDTSMSSYDSIKGNYVPCGLITNTHCYDKDYVDNYFSFVQSFHESYNFIVAIKKLFKYYNIKYVMTFMLDPTIGYHLGEPGFNKDSFTEEEIIIIDTLKKKYNSIIDDNFTDMCMTMHQLDYPTVVYSFRNHFGEEMVEGHPSPKQGYMFMKEQLLPKLPFLEFRETQDLLNCVENWESYAQIKEGVEFKKDKEPLIYPVKKRFYGRKAPTKDSEYFSYYTSPSVSTSKKLI